MTAGYDAQWWQARQAAARTAMTFVPRSRRALIEIAAQHPLTGPGAPGVEFAARLDRGVELVEQLREGGWTVEVFVPGSRHRGPSHAADAVSLSAAGIGYLRPRVASSVVLHGDDLNSRYKGAEGVYGSADECFVTAEYFRDGDFEALHAVLSPQQLTRKLLHYLAFGVEPLLHTAPVPDPHHSIIDEVITEIPRVLYEDPTLQNAGSAAAQRRRAARQVEDAQ